MIIKVFFLIFFLIPSLGFSNSTDSCALKNGILANLTGLPRTLCRQALEAYEKGRQTRENVYDLCYNVKNVAWYTDRDNTMVDANDEVGKAMAVAFGPRGTATMSLQVCPAVYNSVAHGTILNPTKGLKQRESGLTFAPFPMNLENLYTSLDDKNFRSPVMEYKTREEYSEFIESRGTKWQDDYSLIRVGKIRPDTTLNNPVLDPIAKAPSIRPLKLSPDKILELIKSGDMKVYMYRGKSRWALDKNGNIPNGPIEEENAISNSYNGDKLPRIYDKPQRVKRPIRFYGVDYYGKLKTDAPGENSASGAPYIAEIAGQKFLIGMTVSAIMKSFPSDEGEDGRSVAGGTYMAPITEGYCKDLKDICSPTGNTCATFDDVKDLLK